MDALPSACYEFDSFRLDAARSLLLRDGEQVSLPPKTLETLLLLVREAGRVIRKEEFIARIWPDCFVEEGNLTQHIFTLRKALGEGPHDHRYIVTVPGQGYRFVAPVRELLLTDDGAADGGAAARQTDDGRTPEKAREATEAAVASIAVLPFKMLGGDQIDSFLGPGLADALITRLSGVGQISVCPTSAVLKYADSDGSPLVAGRELGVQTILDGHLQRSGERIRVTVQLFRLSDGKTLWAEKFDEKFTDVFSVQDSISEQVASVLVRRLTDEELQTLTKRYTGNTEAFQAYIRGRYFWNKRTAEGLQKAIEYFEQAIAIDPAYALAFAGLADAYNLLAGHGGLQPRETFPKAKAAAERALEIDDSLAEAYASLGFVSYRFDWNRADSERHFKRAIAMKPNYATAHHWYGESLAATGRSADSLAELGRAQELDPLSLPINTDLGQSFYFARRYEEAARQLEKTLEMDHNFPRALIILGAVYEQQGRFMEAIEMSSRAVKVSLSNPLALSGLGHARALAGQHHEARRIVSDLQRLATSRYVSSYNIAIIYAGLGERSVALDYLERAVGNSDVWLVWLKYDPRLDCLRDEPRFDALAQRVNL